MAPQNNAQTIALQLEKVRDKVPLLYERDDVLLSMIQQRGDVEKVSSRNMRLPLQLVPGGKAGSYNADGGDLGRGSRLDVRRGAGLADFFPLRGGNHQAGRVRQSNSREKAIENAVKREIASGMKQFRAFLDKVIQTAGNGVLGTISGLRFGIGRKSGDVQHGHANGRGARVRGADHSGLRFDADHQSRIVRGDRRGSDFFHANDQRRYGSGRNRRQRHHRA